MKITNGQRLKTGLFILGALLVVGVTVFFIGKQKNIFTSTFPVYANFGNVSGLQVGNYVRFAGINVGTVNNIDIVNDTTVRVEMVLQTKVKQYLHGDSRASIGSDGLMGDKLVQVSAGTDSAGVLKNGQLTGVNPLDMDKIMGRLGGIATDAQTITSNLAGIFSKVNNGNGSLGKLLNSDALANNLETTMKSTNQTVQTINRAAGGVSDNMDAAKHSIFFRGYFKKKEKKRIEDSTKQANHIADSIKAAKG
jgi:phospholipid/cholesterol/gamma-HCH transport system substrate-binding protein